MSKQRIYTETVNKIILSAQDEEDVRKYMHNMPKWLVGCSPNWSWGYDNSAYPDFLIDESHPSYAWVQTWEYNPKSGKSSSHYVCKSDDGRAKFHYAGELSLSNETIQDSEGNIRQVWMTRQDGGYAGRHFPIEMADGRYAVLRGPWHGCGQAPYQEVTYRIMNDKYVMGYYGLALHKHLIIAAVRTFMPQFADQLVSPQHVPHFVALHKPCRVKPTVEDAQAIPNWELYQ